MNHYYDPRYRVASILLVFLVAALAGPVYSWVSPMFRGPLKAAVENRTDIALEGLSVVAGQGAPTAFPSIPPGGSATVVPKVDPAAEDLTLIDANGQRYSLLLYFTRDTGGTVTAVVTGRSDGIMTGEIRNDASHSAFSDRLEAEVP